MKNAKRFIILILLCILSLTAAVGIGSIAIDPGDTLKVIAGKLFHIRFSNPVDDTIASILLKTRIPRALLAFVSGAGLAVSGVMMQSVLQNPLASSFTLGVSSGAALGASFVIVLNITFLGFLTLPVFGLTAGIITVFLSLGVAVKVDKGLHNNSIILTGMAFSMFANAMITILMSVSKENMQRLVFWQMGSFSMRTPRDFWMILPFVLIGTIIAMICSRQMDIMTLGDEQAQTSGVDVQKMKWLLLSLGAVLTGAIVSVAGVIGFVDLFTPHVARRLFGAAHKYVIPASALLGGLFMVICDLLARTVVSPLEIPVGAITAVVGAPFFIYLFLNKRERKVK